jgi:N-hydroxyarylamine O-acetyltransferase
MFEEFYQPLPDKDAYLKRIGLQDAKTPDLQTLDALIRAQMLTVPFENLDVYDAETDIKLDTASLFDKIVTRKRGGYCFELNGLFFQLLKSVGYDCYPIAVRVVWMAECYMPLSHRATVVTIDKERYFVDVGFGGPAPHRALRLDDVSEQVSDGQRFFFDRTGDDTVLCRVTDAGKERLLQFSEKPCDPIDFLALSEYQSKSKNSGFKRTRMLNILTESGSKSINGNVLRIHDNGTVAETTLDTPEALQAALKEHFGLNVDFELKV